ncbi:serine/arginine repetitive matrix protein 1-like [Homarus americanus]|uniref:serine/arginine repetitive matrix protein 1-like n=1 Tax=Homarus americanus TaxID=6706 RepID=UPI001C465D9A|nr:serine/arginine repetitive matrix protein 1-like [Homarus americanus]
MTPSIYLLLLAAAAAVLTPPKAHAHPEATPTTHVHTATRNHQTGEYSFGYAVDAPEYRNFQDREEARLGEETRGRFRVALPDNRLQTVLYRANEKGYTALISYDQHPDFPTLRASVGPIGDAPKIGQSVLESIRQGENWKNHKDHHKDGRRPGHVTRQSSHGELDNAVVSTPHHVQPVISRPRPSSVLRPRPTPTQSSPSPAPKRTRTSPTPIRSRPSPTPRRSHPSPTPTRSRLSPTTTRSHPSPTPTQSHPPSTQQGSRRRQSTVRTTSRPSAPLAQTRPVAQPLRAAAPQVTRTRGSTTPGTSVPTIILPNSISIANEDFEEPEILNRLITAIREETEEETETPTVDEHSNEKGPHRRYSIGDKASVLARLGAVVHTVRPPTSPIR